MTWIHESGVHRKNPIRERSGCGGENEIWERLRWRRPKWVKPNSSNGMVERESDRISVRRISEDVRVKRRVTMTGKDNWGYAISCCSTGVAVEIDSTDGMDTAIDLTCVVKSIIYFYNFFHIGKEGVFIG
ncbi:hypothetical protein L1987_15393 [Smallanthus sonchifolius]|uniref:Uncharacterized protein n=1 Tax=Smallanthus sonchifolius TaxID=185202 RepID=A0ACB9J5Z4_9ASTR|nr:hypothetical protein L1987_15393 [Smallanthus sonchifolius]